ncbi:MAG TPA: response regulator, partial [Spirochaetota bacterium]|nr:response regulator [Spirochaetota bacterium]
QKEAERKRLALEHQMLQAQKLESLGLLAGGIAHDFNNLLTAILGNAELLCFDLPDDINLKQKLIDIQRAAKRASELTNQMLAYSGKSRFETKIIDINELIQEVHGLLDVSISKKIKIHYQLDDSIPKILADPSQIVQILMNLTINASEAIENTGDITVTTKMINCTEDTFSLITINQGMKAGNYILLEITDTGCGISEDKIKQIFDPFYTTKFTGRGLGLSAVSGIIRNHNGGLNVKSTIGKGTTFSIYLPIHGNNIPVTEESPVTIEKISIYNITVLVVDDEAYIRTLTSRMLKNAGYTAVLADNGLEALQIFRDKKDSIDCVLLDLTMPELDGKETLAAIRKIDKNIPVIISSGYSEADIRASFGDNTISGVLQKPYQYEDLIKIIQINIKRNFS